MRQAYLESQKSTSQKIGNGLTFHFTWRIGGDQGIRFKSDGLLSYQHGEPVGVSPALEVGVEFVVFSREGDGDGK